MSQSQRRDERRSIVATLGRPMQAGDVMNAREVAELTGMPESTIRHLSNRDVIPSRKLGRRRLYLRCEIEALLSSSSDS